MEKCCAVTGKVITIPSNYPSGTRTWVVPINFPFSHPYIKLVAPVLALFAKLCGSATLLGSGNVNMWATKLDNNEAVPLVGARIVSKAQIVANEEPKVHVA